MVRETPLAPDAARPRGRGPERFQQQPEPEARSPLAAAGALVALLGLVVGVPVGLVALGAVPSVPTSLPTRADLLGAVGAEQVLAVLVAVVWLAWLQFCVCVAVEVVSALRDGGLPRPVPLAAPSQRLARVLVGSLLLTGVVAGQASAAAPLAGHDQPVAAVASTDLAPPAAPPAPGAPRGGGAEVAAVAAPALPPELADLVGRRVYTVVPPEGRYHDNLWDIAERELGDGRRYAEIYALNEDRVQPDGRELELARLIQPGWQLVMPEDAVGVERLVAPAPPPAPAPAQAPAAPSTGGAPVDAGTADGGAEGADAADEGAVAPAPQGALGLGALAAAGLASALARRRRSSPGADPGEEAAEAEAQLRVGADPAREALLLRALRSLGAAGPRGAGGSSGASGAGGSSGAYAVLVADGEVEVRLAPPRPDAPAPWTSADGGARWVVTAADLAGAPEAPDAPAGPFVALVGLGHDVAGRDVLVDLAAAAGPVEVTGPGAHEVVAALAAELVTSPWGQGLDVALWHLPAALAGLGPRAELVEDAGALLAPVPEPDLLTGLRPPAASAPRRALVLGAAPPAPVAESLAAGGATAVLVAGAAPGARWALRVDDAGCLAVDALDLSVTANRLGERALARVGELFRALEGSGGPEDGPGDGDDRPPVPPGPAVDDAAWAAARVRVGVLGALRVEAPGAVDPSRRELVEEVVAHVALHPGGVHPTVLGGDVWPQGAGAAVRAAVVDRARDVLGAEPGGSYRLGEDDDGRLVLGAGAVVDRDVLGHLLRRSRSAPPGQERELLRRALVLVRAPLLEGRPPRRYGWLPRTGAERTTAALVVDAALRLGALEGSGGDPDGAAAAATAGLRAVPASQPLWRLLLSSRAAGGAGTREAERALRAALAAAGEVPDGETEALLAELAPTTGPAEDRAG